jgi:nucleotide-binding universal stress UspA family protein
MSAFRTIVVATDFSDTSREALDVALSIARDSGSQIHLLHVIPDPLRQPWMVEPAGLDFRELQRLWTQEARRQLDALTTGRNLDPHRVLTAIAIGSAAAEIVRYATDHHADLILLGTHGYGAVRRFLLGSVAERVLRQAQSPVLIVPHRTLRLGVTTDRETAAAV